MKEYTAHFVPCKVRYTGTTKEFEGNFYAEINEEVQTGEQNMTPNGECQPIVTYLRGRKLIGRSFLNSERCRAVLVEAQTDDEPSNTSPSVIIKPTAVIDQMINYERDGNEERLVEEMDKFQEYLDILDVIHS